MEIWKKVLDQGEYIYAIFMDPSKAFDTLNHDLLIAKLGAHGFETDTLRYMKSYLMKSKEVRNSRVTKSSYKINLCKMTSGFRVTTSASENTKFDFELLPQRF